MAKGEAAVTDLKKGLMDRSAKFPDESCKCTGGSVDSQTTRSEVGKSHSIGGRQA